jgi:hypothetical protein
MIAVTAEQERLARLLEHWYRLGIREGKAQARLGGGPDCEQLCQPEWNLIAIHALKDVLR